jgi:N-acetylneuraminic acid mutarotase
MKTARMLLILVLALGMASLSLAAGDTWTAKSPMPTARWGLSTSVVEGKIYAIGGGQSPYGAYLSSVEEYDPATDTWTRKADMPTARAYLSTSVVNGKIYAIGGSPRPDSSTSTVEAYDPATDTWTRKADMPTARTLLSSSVLNGKIYSIGGRMYPGDNVSTVEEYDPATDTWTRKADMPAARACLSTCVVDGIVYAIGGIVGSFGGPGVSAVEAYDPATDTWTRKADMPTARKLPSTSVVKSKIFAIGGGTGYANVFSTVEEYDPATDTWTKKADMPTARESLSTSVVNGKIYSIGGDVTGFPWSPTSTVEEYDTGLGVPLPDFNGDGTVDIKDLLRLIESWGQNDPVVDITPPFGDGIVDVLDLELLMSYWGQPVDDPTLIAHWTLDEAEGDIAYDSAGYNDAVIFGDPAWQPESGMVDGALSFDGFDDYVSTEFVLNPTDGKFSVFEWIKGGAPGQVVIAQKDGVNWLCADSSEGNLMTELKGAGRGSAELLSQTNITDGNWHRIGLVWDGSHRMLYVDDIAVAEDAQPNLEGFYNGLYIGTGKSMELGSFWSGLIDDVRIYNRAVTP